MGETRRPVVRHAERCRHCKGTRLLGLWPPHPPEGISIRHSSELPVALWCQSCGALEVVPGGGIMAAVNQTQEILLMGIEVGDAQPQPPDVRLRAEIVTHLRLRGRQFIDGAPVSPGRVQSDVQIGQALLDEAARIEGEGRLQTEGEAPS